MQLLFYKTDLLVVPRSVEGTVQRKIENMPIEIKTGDIETVAALSKEIEEFHDPHDEAEYKRRLTGVPSIILVAYEGEEAVGFKVGYERDGQFYSWMGGVKANWRRKGVAKTLADKQEDWARQQGYTSITFKTRNRLKAMLVFALQNGFNIVKVIPMEQVGEYRILLRKQLK